MTRSIYNLALLLSGVLSLFQLCSCSNERVGEKGDRRQTMVDAYYKIERLLLSNEEDKAKIEIETLENLFAEPLSTKEAAMVADVYDNLGYVYKTRLNNYPQAFVFFNKGIRVCDKYGIQEKLPRLFLNIGTIYQCFEDSAKVFKYFEQAFRQAERCRKGRTAMIALCSLLSYKMDAQDFRGADATWSAYPLKNGGEDTVLSNYTGLILEGYLDMCEGRNDRASQVFDSALRCSGDGWEAEEMKATAILAKAHALMRNGSYEEAASSLRQALDSLDDVKIQGNLPGIYRLLSKAYTSSGNKSGADSIMNCYYRLNYDKFGAKGANALSDFVYEQEQARHQIQMSNMASRQRNMWLFIIIGAIAISIIMALLVWLMRKEKRKSQLMHDLYCKAVSAVPGQGVVSEILNNPDDASISADSLEYKESGSAEDEAFLSEIYDELKKSMTSSDRIFEQGFTINSLAELMGYPPYIVSKAINVIGHRNFSTLLAECRVSEACRRIIDDANYSQYTIEAIGKGVGFKSRTNFATVFKKITGLSPTEFKKQHSRLRL